MNPQTKLQLNQLIGDGKLTEALDILKSGEASKETFDFIYRIVSEALNKSDVALAATAASYTLGWNTKPPKEASWNAIIHQAFKQGGLPALDIPTHFLTPEYHRWYPLDAAAVDIWNYFREHNWDVPGYEVIFEAEGYSPFSNTPVLAYKVAQIRNKDFVLCFNEEQGRMKESYYTLDSAGFNGIAVPNLVMEFYKDGSGPSVYEYTGHDWSKSIATMSNYPNYRDEPHWKNIWFPGSQPSFLSDVRQAKKDNEKRPLEYFINKAVAYLRNEVIPQLENNLDSANQYGR